MLAVCATEGMAAFGGTVTLRRDERLESSAAAVCLHNIQPRRFERGQKKKKQRNKGKNKERNNNMNFRRRYGLLPPSFRWEERILFHGITL